MKKRKLRRKKKRITKNKIQFYTETEKLGTHKNMSEDKDSISLLQTEPKAIFDKSRNKQGVATQDPEINRNYLAGFQSVFVHKANENDSNKPIVNNSTPSLRKEIKIEDNMEFPKKVIIQKSKSLLM